MKRIVFLALLVAACGSRAPPPEPPDPTLAYLSRTALAAWNQGRLAQAVELFRDALRRAYAHDDAEAIADLSASLAVAELRLARRHGFATRHPQRGPSRHVAVWLFRPNSSTPRLPLCIEQAMLAVLRP